MRGKLKKEGNYELFKTTKGHEILNLEDREFYALVEGQQGDLIVHSDEDHKKQSSVSSGKYYFADFDNDPEFRDMAHLFLQDNTKFRELILPQGLPTKSDHQRKLVRTKNKISQSKVEEHVKGRGDKGTEKQYSDQEEGLRARSKEELYELAKKHDIEGRSKMNKEELIKKLKGKVD